MTLNPPSAGRFAACAALAGTLLLSLPAAQALAQTAQPARPAPMAGIGGNSREPIKIDADRLDVFDRENRAVFAGNVVAVQGETTIRCSSMTVFYERGGNRPGSPPATPAPAAAPGGDSAVRKVDCAGPVTVMQRDQVATGNNATFDRVANIVTITGNAALSQGQNVTRGERVLYNLNTGVANVEGGRVRALIVPGSESAPAGAPAPARPPARGN
jgi:lipopolysaccharide export system protein LptA